MLTLGSLNRLDGIRHAFFSREGGVSEGVYASLNCGLGSGDDPARVLENRARVAEHIDLEPEALLTCRQVHGVTVAEVEQPWTRENAPEADAMVTQLPGIALGILTADCAPILLADPVARVIGAAHAGWRGALSGVIETTVAVMARRGADPKRIVAGVGPCIAQRSYEVGPEFPAQFLAADGANQAFFAPGRGEKLQFDMRSFVASALGRAGVRRIYDLPHDTCREERFFSYRRACLHGEKDYGRSLSVITLEP